MKTCPQCSQRYPDDSAFCFICGTSLPEPPDPRIGSTIAGRYILEAVLGKGGMATVYKARPRLFGGQRAVKILSADFAQDPSLRERFMREVKNSRRIVHPNVIEIFDSGDTDDGVPYLVMELLEGKSIAQFIEQGKVPLRRAIPIWIQMARALARAHDFDVIHRDLKPENIFVFGADRVKLLDFGIALSKQDARLTNLGEVFGTPQYMAPERIRSADASGASDLYSLGVIMFEMLTQKLPFDAQDPNGWISAHLKQQPIRATELLPDLPEQIDSLIASLLEKEPLHRPVDAHKVVIDLTNYARELGFQVPSEGEAKPPPPPPIPPPPGQDLWAKRADLFDRIFKRAGSPPELARTADTLRGNALRLSELQAASYAEQQKLQVIEEAGYKERLRIGQEMAAKTIDASSIRAEARTARSRAGALGSKVKAFPPQILAAHKEAVVWEGRSGFTEPYRELARAYKKLADLNEQWWRTRQDELEAESVAVDAEKALGDVDVAVRELRAQLSEADEKYEAERRDGLMSLSRMGAEADERESEFVGIASRFTAPLRSKPELGQLFQEMARDKGGR